MTLTRREFLATAAAVPSLAYAQDSPNERLRVAVIGVRGRGANHVSMWHRLKDVEVAAICDVDPSVIKEPMAEVEKRTGKRPAYYKDVRKLLEDKSIDAVSIATPNHWHSLAAIWAVEAGKDAYVEKPISHNVWEGRRLVEAARKHGRCVANGTQSRSKKSIRDAIAYLHAGKLGKVKLATALCYKDRRSIGKKADAPVPEGVDYDLWLGPAPVGAFNPDRFHYEWHWNWDYGNGDIGNQGAHQMDVARWGLGKSDGPKSVVSLGGRFGYEDDGQTPNTQIAVLDYGDCKIVFEVRGLVTEPYRKQHIGVVFHAEQGSLVIGNLENAAYGPDGEQIQRFSGGDDTQHFRNFVDAVRARKPEMLTADALEGHLSASLHHLANISHRLGSPQPMSKDEPLGKYEEGNEAFRRFREHLTKNGVDAAKTPVVVGPTLAFDAKTEKFGDERADALLTREYRKPFTP